MKRLVSTIGLPKEEWLMYRKKGITGTDAGAITGLNPYVSAFQIYQDKRTDEIEKFDNEAMRQGRDMEAYVAERFEEETGYKVRRANAIFQNEEHPFMLADFDRLVVGMPNGQRAGLECKTVSPYSSVQWKDGQIPLHYQMQVQHYLAVSGFDCWYVAALIFGREFIIRKVERDEELIQYLITIEERFWNENVLGGIMPAPDGSENCSKIIASLYYNADKEKSVPLLGCNDMLDRRKEIDELLKKLDKEKKEIEQKIKLEMKDAAYGTTEDYKVSWSSYEKTSLDSKRLKEERPEIYADYVTSNSYRRFTVTPVA